MYRTVCKDPSFEAMLVLLNDGGLREKVGIEKGERSQTLAEYERRIGGLIEELHVLERQLRWGGLVQQIQGYIELAEEEIVQVG